MARPPASDGIQRYRDAQSLRSPNEADWRMSAAYCLPRHYAAWNTSEGPANYGTSVSNTRRINYDTTATRAVPKYAAVLERMCTPHNMRWHGLTASDANLMKNRRVREYFQELSDLMFKMRYLAPAGFKDAMSETYTGLGVYGTAPIYLGQRTPNALYQKPSFLYKSCPLRDVYILVNDEGEVDTVIRRFWLNNRQFKQKFPNEPLPPTLARKESNGAKPKDGDYVEFIHIVHPRSDYDPTSINVNRHPIIGNYICVPDQAYVGEEQGFRSMPYKIPRVFTEPGNPYGYAPAMQVLPAMGSASAMKKTNLKQGQKAVDPVLLVHDDGVMNGVVDLRPGAQNYGGVDKQGRKLIQTLDSGNFQVAEYLLNGERDDINDVFFVKLFQILMDTPEMTAAEVYERVAEKSSLCAPTMHRVNKTLEECIAREMDMLDEMGKGPQLPPELVEAAGEYEVIWTSPMSKGMYAEEVSGFVRSVEIATNVAAQTGDNSHLDHFNFNVAIPEMSDRMAVPARWMNDDKTKKALATARAEQQKQAELMKNAAPLAGALKTAATMQQEA